MCRDREWEEDLRNVLDSDSTFVRKRTQRVLGGPAAEGDSVWEREETKAADQDGNVHTLDVVRATRGACGCVLTQNTVQIACRLCGHVVCEKHALACEVCQELFCPADVVVHGRDDNRRVFCRRHRISYYWRKWWGI